MLGRVVRRSGAAIGWSAGEGGAGRCAWREGAGSGGAVRRERQSSARPFPGSFPVIPETGRLQQVPHLASPQPVRAAACPVPARLLLAEAGACSPLWRERAGQAAAGLPGEGRGGEAGTAAAESPSERCLQVSVGVRPLSSLCS